MSDTTQYPDGPYLVTLPSGTAYAINVESDKAWEGHFYDINGWWQSVTDALGKGYTLTPLVPSTELDAARQRIAELEAEVERLREKPTEPTLDEMVLAISERGLPFVLQGWGRTWWVDYWDNRTVDQPTPSEAIRAAWEAVCKEPQP